MSDDISRRLAALRQHFESFTIQGRGLQVQGSIKDGFTLAYGVGDGGGGTGSSPSTVEVLPPETVTLACDSVSASLSKCGFEPLSDGVDLYAEASYAGGGPNVGLEGPTGIGPTVSPDALFLKRTEVASGTTHPEDELNSGCNPNAYQPTHTGTLTVVQEYDPANCTLSTTSCEGSVVTTATIDPGDYGEVGHDPPGFGQPYDAILTTDCGAGDCVRCDQHPLTSTPLCQGWEGTITLEDEYTTAMLLANTIAALPAYDNDFNDSCSASRDLASDETSYTIQRLKYKFTFESTGASFAIHWVERFTPEVGSPVDTPRSTVIGPADTESPVFTLNESNTNGTTTIEDITILG